MLGNASVHSKFLNFALKVDDFTNSKLLEAQGREGKPLL